jgi:hypothetical protein
MASIDRTHGYAWVRLREENQTTYLFFKEEIEPHQLSAYIIFHISTENKNLGTPTSYYSLLAKMYISARRKYSLRFKI